MSVTDRVFPVVFLNDGQNQFTDRGMWGGWHTDSTAARLMRAGRMQDTVLVAVEMHPNRNRAYLPRGMHGHRRGKRRTTPTSSLTRCYRSCVAATVWRQVLGPRPLSARQTGRSTPSLPGCIGQRPLAWWVPILRAVAARAKLHGLGTPHRGATAARVPGLRHTVGRE